MSCFIVAALFFIVILLLGEDAIWISLAAAAVLWDFGLIPI
jgi:hypothetical protein